MAIKIIEPSAGPTGGEAKQRATDILDNISTVKWSPSGDKYGTLSDGWEWEFRNNFCPGLTDCVSPETTCEIAKKFPVDMTADDACRPCVKLIREIKLDSAQAGKAKLDKAIILLNNIKEG
jgi:hypothetical protein